MRFASDNKTKFIITTNVEIIVAPAIDREAKKDTSSSDKINAITVNKIVFLGFIVLV